MSLRVIPLGLGEDLRVPMEPVPVMACSTCNSDRGQRRA